MLRLDVETLCLGTAICLSLNSGPNLGKPHNGETGDYLNKKMTEGKRLAQSFFVFFVFLFRLEL